MTPFDVVATEKFMREHKIKSIIIDLSNGNTYHCWINDLTGNFRYHIHNND